MSDKKINSIETSNHSTTPNLSDSGTKTKVKFKGSCLKQDTVTFNHGTIIDIYLVYEISKNFTISRYPTLENCFLELLVWLKMLILISTNILDMELDLIDMDFFSHSSGETGKSMIIFGVDTSSYTRIDNRRKIF